MASHPLVTVIMPIRNEAAYIRRSLGSVLAQDYPQDRLEILVVDGMSDDGTRGIVRNMIDEAWTTSGSCHPQVRLLDNPQQIVSTALNIGLKNASGGIIVRVDGHCEIPPDYLRRCVACLEQYSADCVGGPIETVGETSMAQAIAAAMSSSFGVGGSPFRVGHRGMEFVDTLAFGAYRRQAIERCGDFDEELVRNQDDEYNYRLRKLGGRILLDSSLRSRYFSRGTLGKLWRQYFQYGYWKVRVLQKHPRQMQPRQFVPPLFVLALVGGGLLAPVNRPVRRLWTALLALYTGLNLVASGITAARRGWRHLPLLPLIFGILHVGYGAGFCLGLVAFASRWFYPNEQKP